MELGNDAFRDRPRDNSLNELVAEVDGYYASLVALVDKDPGDVFQKLAAIAARVAEIRNYLHKRTDKQSQVFRTRSVEKLLEDVDRTYTLLSRQEAVRQFEWQMEHRS